MNKLEKSNLHGELIFVYIKVDTLTFLDYFGQFGVNIPV